MGRAVVHLFGTITSDDTRMAVTPASLPSPQNAALIPMSDGIQDNRNPHFSISIIRLSWLAVLLLTPVALAQRPNIYLAKWGCIAFVVALTIK